MQLNLDTKLHVHNRYDFELRDSRTGELKQTAYAENVVLNNMWTLLGAASRAGLNMFYGIAMGTGTGTPAATDTAMFTPGFNYNTTFTFVSRTEAYPTCAYTYKIDIPATASYVGNLTEVGIYGRNSYDKQILLWTHAILKDSEGNPIMIEKTDLDILVVTATIYVTFSSSDANFHWYAPGPCNAICAAFRTTDGYTPFSSTSLAYCGTLFQRDDGCITSADNVVNVGSGNYNAANKTITVTTTRMGTTTGNTRFYNGLILGYNPTDLSNRKLIGGIVFPNTSVFPQYTIEDMRVGTGDGTTTEFTIPIEYFVANTDVLKVNGTTLTRNTDYTIDNINTLNTADDTMNLSNFLEFVSDTPSAAHAKQVVTYPFSHQIEGDSTPYLSTTPIIYKVTDACPRKSTNVVNITNLSLLATDGLNNSYGPYGHWPKTDALKFYETRNNLTFTTATQETIEEVIQDIIDNPDNYVHSATPGTFIAKVVPTHTNYLGNAIRIIQKTSSEVYYFLWGVGAAQRLYWVSTDRNCFTNATHYRSYNPQPNDWALNYLQTVRINTVTWYYASIPCTDAQFITEDCWCTSLWYDNADMFNGCSIKISGGPTVQGPWTTEYIIPITTLDQLSNSGSEYYRGGIATRTATGTPADYNYYKVELDVSNGTSADMLDTPAVRIQWPTIQADLLSLGYTGGKIHFSTAPAADAVITLTADIDRPFKNSNFVIDTSMILQFGGA